MGDIGGIGGIGAIAEIGAIGHLGPVHESCVALPVMKEATIKNPKIPALVREDSPILDKCAIPIVLIVDDAIVVEPSDHLPVSFVDGLHCRLPPPEV